MRRSSVSLDIFLQPVVKVTSSTGVFTIHGYVRCREGFISTLLASTRCFSEGLLTRNYVIRFYLPPCCGRMVLIALRGVCFFGVFERHSAK